MSKTPARAWAEALENLADPGKKKHVVDTHNRYIYFYAESPAGKKRIWTGDLPQWFEGKRYLFFKVDMGTSLEDFTYTFICN